MSVDAEKEAVATLDATLHFSKKAHASPARSLAKTLSWRAVGSIDTFVISYIATGQAKIGFTIASAEVLTKLGLYYLHERGWAHIRWGLK